MAEKENKEIEKAMDIIKEMSMDPKEWELYESRRLAIMDYNTGMEQAKLDGIEERNKKRTEKRKNWNCKENVRKKYRDWSYIRTNGIKQERDCRIRKIKNTYWYLDDTCGYTEFSNLYYNFGENIDIYKIYAYLESPTINKCDNKFSVYVSNDNGLDIKEIEKLDIHI